MSKIIFMARLTDKGDFAAVRRAETLLQQHGFSVGSMQRGSPRGILFGHYDIQKWRNLNELERNTLHGVLGGDRSSDAVIEIWFPAPIETVSVLADAIEGQPNTVITKRPHVATTISKPYSRAPSPTDGPHNIPQDPADARSILRTMIYAGQVDRRIGEHLFVTLEAYRRGIITL